MVAPAPITNETPAWDVLDPFPKSHARARQTKSGNPLSKSLTYSYDAVGNRRSLDAPDSGRFSYVYDAADQLSSVLNPFSELTTFSYDIAGRRTVQRYSNGTRASIIYDTANNVTQFHNRTSTGTAITTNDYKYDNVGNRTGMLEASGDRLTWTYDNGDQLKSERRSGASGYANTFTYDGVGNRTLKDAGATRTTFSYDVADQLVYSQAVAGRTSYVYDNAGNQQIERPPTGSRTTTVWDNENRPTLYRLPDTTLVTMSYNGNNRRVTKQTATETVKFVWDPAADAYLAEFNSSNVLQATYSQEPVQFGRALSQRRSTTSSWYHTDALGSTQALSNSSQVTSDTYLYDAWGNPITSTGTTINPFRWVGNVGYYFDSDTGLYYIRARTYQPIIARWTSADPLFYMLAKTGALGAFTRDPIQFEAGFNFYAYLNCLRDSDPSGLMPCASQKATFNYESTETPSGFGSVGGVLQKVLGLVNSPALQGVMPCKLKLAGSVSTENYSCPSCCSDGSGGTNGFFKLASTAGVKVSCNSNGGVGVYVNVSGGIDVEVGLDRKWDTCIPKDETNACLKLKGSMSISLCTGIAAIGTRACAKLTLECNGGYCVNHAGGSNGWSGGCKLYVSGEACAFFQCVGGSYPPIIEFP